MNNIFVNICENDENGSRSGRVHQFHFEDEHGEMFLLLECKFLEGIAIHSSNPGMPGRIEMYGGCFIKFESVQDWAGNMAWNMYKMPGSYALGLIRLLQQKKDFSISEAWSDVADKWNAGEIITAADIGLPEGTEPVIVNPDQIEMFTTNNRIL